MIVSDLFIYPIKSCQGISLNQAEVTPKGLKCDREFMLVDSDGKFLTQRQYPQLATIQVKIDGNFLSLSQVNSHLKPFSLEINFQGQEIPVLIWRDHTIGIDQGDAVSQWFQEALKLPNNQTCRLVKQSPKYIRPIDPKYAPKENLPVNFSDGYPLLIIGEGSLIELNKKLESKYPNQNQQVPMNRFRPNVVMNTKESFLEDKWSKIKIGEIEFLLVKPCSRCLITTTDQNSGKRNELQEPFTTLTAFRKKPKMGILFGQNMIPNQTGIIKVGDTITVLESQ